MIKWLIVNTVKYCFRCGGEVPPEAGFCPGCGAKIDY